MIKKNNNLFTTKIFNLLFIFILSQNLLFAISERDALEKFFTEPYSFTGSECKPDCRILVDTDKYMTKLIDFDAASGISVCEVYPKNSGDNELFKLSVNANSQNLKCVEEFNSKEINYEDENLSSVKFNKKENRLNPTIDEYQRNQVTMSRFIAGLATLDDDVLDIENSRTGDIQERNSTNIYQIKSVGSDNKDRLLNAIDTLSTNNLSYYIDLFYNMDKIYEYLVAYVFVFISLFFMILYASKIALKKVAKKTTAFDEPWQTKVAIIVFSTVIFFIPIKMNNDYSSTLFQNIWKYFVEESSAIADKANTIAMQTYMKKVYNTTGASGVETEANLVLIQKQQAHLLEKYKTSIKLCEERYPQLLTFQKTDLSQIKNIEDRIGNNDDDKLTLRACRAIEKRNKLAFTAEEQASLSLKRIQLAYESPTEIRERLNKMTEHINTRVQELGWYSSLLAPTLQVLTKISFLQGNEDINNPTNTNGYYRAKINEATLEKIAKTELEKENGNNISKLLNTEVENPKDKTSKSLAEILSNTALLSFVPGASTIHNFIKDFSGKDVDSLIKKLEVDKNSTIVAGLSKNTKGLVFTTTLVKFIIEVLPFITTFIAIGIIIILYIYELIVFSFISPFVVAFAVTTGQARKILDFLVTALTIFLKPTLIVIAIYLALFLYSIFQDIFILMADEQFYLSLASTKDFLPSLLFHFVKEVLSIFAAFASVFFMWKLIMQMPDFIFKLIGLEGLGSSSQMANSMQQSFGKFGFRA